MRSPRARVIALLPVLSLVAAAPVGAHGWLEDQRAMRAEYQAEFDAARSLYRLDCAGQAAYIAQQNWLINQRTYAEYHRLMPGVSSYARPAVPGISPYLVAPRPR